jgi:hypothetical protein
VVQSVEHSVRITFVRPGPGASFLLEHSSLAARVVEADIEQQLSGRLLPLVRLSAQGRQLGVADKAISVLLGFADAGEHLELGGRESASL